MEVLIAGVILVSGLMTFGMFSGNVVQKNSESRQRTLATTLAQEKVEQFRDQVPRGQILNSVTGSEKLNEDGTIDPGGRITRSWTITNGGEGNLSSLGISVSWPGAGNNTVILDTFISQ